jgi:hypothetical protein
MSDILAQLGKEGKRSLKYISQQTGILESRGTKSSNNTSCYICNRTSADPNRRKINITFLCGHNNAIHTSVYVKIVRHWDI